MILYHAIQYDIASYEITILYYFMIWYCIIGYNIILYKMRYHQNRNNMIYHISTIIKQASLSEVRSSFLSIFDNDDQALYLMLALCLKFKPTGTWTMQVVSTACFPTFKPALNYSKHSTCPTLSIWSSLWFIYIVKSTSFTKDHHLSLYVICPKKKT